MMRLNITTTSGCRGRCAYCPQGDYQAAALDRPRHLTASEFRRLVPKLGQRFREISFGGFSEPFDNPELVELLELSAALTDRLSIHTIGDLVTPDVLERMAHLAIDRLDVSCHGFDPRVYRAARPFVDPQAVRRNLLHLFDHRANIRKLVVSMTGPFGGAAARAELAALCRRHGAYLDVRALHGRAGLLRIARRDRAHGRFRCGKHDFEKPVLIPGGDVVLCCQDFALRMPLGNLHDAALDELIARSPVRRHVLAVAAGEASDPSLPCYQCEFCEPLPHHPAGEVVG